MGNSDRETVRYKTIKQCKKYERETNRESVTWGEREYAKESKISRKSMSKSMREYEKG